MMSLCRLVALVRYAHWLVHLDAAVRARTSVFHHGEPRESGRLLSVSLHRLGDKRLNAVQSQVADRLPRGLPPVELMNKGFSVLEWLQGAAMVEMAGELLESADAQQADAAITFGPERAAVNPVGPDRPLGEALLCAQPLVVVAHRVVRVGAVASDVHERLDWHLAL